MYSYLEKKQDKESLGEYTAKNGTDWTWGILPADSAHQNGAAEAAVKVIKQALQSLGIGDGLTFSEFLTVVKLAANLSNERPIDARVQSHEDCIE